MGRLDKRALSFGFDDSQSQEVLALVLQLLLPADGEFHQIIGFTNDVWVDIVVEKLAELVDDTNNPVTFLLTNF